MKAPAPALLLLALLAATSPFPADASSRREVSRVFEKIRKHWEKGEVDSIAGMLPPEGKVKIALRGLTPGEYRREQAHALIRKYFASIETKQFKLDDGPRGSSARFKHVFVVREDRHEETRYTFLTLDREQDQWVIVEMIED